MAKQFRSWDVDQAWLLPPSVQDLVPPGHLAHFIRETVRESLDLSPILADYAEEGGGQPPFHPAMMVALLLYAYSQGRYSSRKIAQDCENRVDFMAVTALEKPNFRTIALFRKRHLNALGELFRQVLGLCARAGLVKLGHVGLDGTKIRANASKHKAMSYGRMEKAERELAAEVSNWLESAEEIDSAEDSEHGERRGDELPEWVQDKQKRLEKIQQAKRELEEEAAEKARKKAAKIADDPARPARKSRNPGVPKENAQRNFTDPESRIMKSGDGFVQGYNAQAAVDLDHQIIVAHGLTNSASDGEQLEPLVKSIRENVGRQAKEISADKGYCSEKNLKELARRRIRGYVATGKQSHGQSAPTKGRVPAAGTYTRAMWRRLKQGGWRSRYRLRKVTAEPVFGQIKSARGFRQFLLRGLEQVRSEWALVCTAHNLLKLAKA